jgi:uncharacterized protein YbbK (DUF523 family)
MIKLTRIVISKCLGFEPTRYNGEIIQVKWVRELSAKASIVPVCPEVDIGLGIPRNPINLVKDENGVSVIQDVTQRDISEELVSYSQGYLRFIGEVDAFILKSKSPSCGLDSTKIHQEGGVTLGSGVFAALAQEMFSDAVFVDERFMDEKGVTGLLKLIE